MLEPVVGVRAEPLDQVEEPGALLQVDLVGHRSVEARDVLHAAAEPVLVLDDGDDDLGDAERGDGEVVRAQPQRDLADEPRRAGGEQTADRPGKDDRQTGAAEIAGGGTVDAFDLVHRRVEEDAGDEEAGDEDDRRPRRAQRFSPHEAAQQYDQQCGSHHHRERNAEPRAARRPCFRHRRLRDEHAGQAAERSEAHHADVEKTGVAPLHVEAERHDRGDQAEVEDREADHPRLADPDRDQQRCHSREEQRRAQPGRVKPGRVESHLHDSTRPRKIPVGRTSSTTTRMTKEIASL